MELLRINIDGKNHCSAKGTTLLHAAKSNGINIPTHCYDEACSPTVPAECALWNCSGGQKEGWSASCLYEVEEVWL